MDYFAPSRQVLQRYAQVLVNYALNSGLGIKKGEVVRLVVSECAKPLYVQIRNQIIRSGGHVISAYLPDDVSREVLELATDAQLSFYPEKYFAGMAAQIDHTISIISETNKYEFEGIDPVKIFMKSKSAKKYRDLLNEKEQKGKYTWTLGLYGTNAMAVEAEMTLEEYWNEIIRGCLLDVPDPIAEWRKVESKTKDLIKKLDLLSIEKVNIKGAKIDLDIKLGNDRKWLGGSGRNIPSFEVFISPDWRGTNGYIEFNQPLYRYGSKVTNIKLEFKDGIVVTSSASHNYNLLQKMINEKNANKIGEFSLTDKRLSRIQKFMAETLFDENISGPFGNTHIALGSAYKDSYKGDLANIAESEWETMGFNDSIVHSDVVSTEDRIVTATLADDTQIVIYKDGQFII